MFENLIQKIQDHPRYGPAMQGVATEKLPLVLNYHTHTGADDYCVSICSLTESPIKMLDAGPGDIEELVHIKGFGKTEADCVPLSVSLGQALTEHYGLDELPNIYLNGKPLPTGDGDGGNGKPAT